MDWVDALLNRWQLRVGSEICHIVEVEYYADPDPYIHQAIEQQVPYAWYFHKVNPVDLSIGGFKGGTYKGLDLTIGVPGYHASFLIRSLQTQTGMIEGPSKVVDYILEQTQCAHIVDLLQQSHNYPPSALDMNYPLCLVASLVLFPSMIYSGPRVGLKLRKQDGVDSLRTQYVMRPFRYTTVPQSLTKGKALLALHTAATRDISLLFGSYLTRWLQDKEEGESMSYDNIRFDRVRDLCRAYGYLSQRGYVE
jgi:hypothetical protein